ncbi:MAG: hypothetical protein LBQ81_04815 [Zoogloeaceae bacterium]|jgi:hypothetical protein|nr:hypothetical protein [Zoogloeaceae bacterium]
MTSNQVQKNSTPPPKVTLWRLLRTALLTLFVVMVLFVIWIDSNLKSPPLPEPGKEMRDEFIAFTQQRLACRKLDSTNAAVTNIAEKYINPGDDFLSVKEFFEKMILWYEIQKKAGLMAKMVELPLPFIQYSKTGITFYQFAQ